MQLKQEAQHNGKFFPFNYKPSNPDYTPAEVMLFQQKFLVSMVKKGMCTAGEKIPAMYFYYYDFIDTHLKTGQARFDFLATLIQQHKTIQETKTEDHPPITFTLNVLVKVVNVNYVEVRNVVLVSANGGEASTQESVPKVKQEHREVVETKLGRDYKKGHIPDDVNITSISAVMTDFLAQFPELALMKQQGKTLIDIANEAEYGEAVKLLEETRKATLANFEQQEADFAIVLLKETYPENILQAILKDPDSPLSTGEPHPAIVIFDCFRAQIHTVIKEQGIDVARQHISILEKASTSKAVRDYARLCDSSSTGNDDYGSFNAIVATLREKLTASQYQQIISSHADGDALSTISACNVSLNSLFELLRQYSDHSYAIKNYRNYSNVSELHEMINKSLEDQMKRLIDQEAITDACREMTVLVNDALIKIKKLNTILIKYDDYAKKSEAFQSSIRLLSKGEAWTLLANDSVPIDNCALYLYDPETHCDISDDSLNNIEKRLGKLSQDFDVLNDNCKTLRKWQELYARLEKFTGPYEQFKETYQKKLQEISDEHFKKGEIWVVDFSQIEAGISRVEEFFEKHLALEDEGKNNLSYFSKRPDRSYDKKGDVIEKIKEVYQSAQDSLFDSLVNRSDYDPSRVEVMKSLCEYHINESKTYNRLFRPSATSISKACDIMDEHEAHRKANPELLSRYLIALCKLQDSTSLTKKHNDPYDKLASEWFDFFEKILKGELESDNELNLEKINGIERFLSLEMQHYPFIFRLLLLAYQPTGNVYNNRVAKPAGGEDYNFFVEYLSDELNEEILKNRYEFILKNLSQLHLYEMAFFSSEISKWLESDKLNAMLESDKNPLSSFATFGGEFETDITHRHINDLTPIFSALYKKPIDLNIDHFRIFDWQARLTENPSPLMQKLHKNLEKLNAVEKHKEMVQATCKAVNKALLDTDNKEENVRQLMQVSKTVAKGHSSKRWKAVSGGLMLLGLGLTATFVGLNIMTGGLPLLIAAAGVGAASVASSSATFFAKGKTRGSARQVKKLAKKLSSPKVTERTALLRSHT